MSHQLSCTQCLAPVGRICCSQTLGSSGSTNTSQIPGAASGILYLRVYIGMGGAGSPQVKDQPTPPPKHTHTSGQLPVLLLLSCLSGEQEQKVSSTLGYDSCPHSSLNPHFCLLCSGLGMSPLKLMVTPMKGASLTMTQPRSWSCLPPPYFLPALVWRCSAPRRAGSSFSGARRQQEGKQHWGRGTDIGGSPTIPNQGNGGIRIGDTARS